jgi:hypothetical protein
MKSDQFRLYVMDSTYIYVNMSTVHLCSANISIDGLKLLCTVSLFFCCCMFLYLPCQKVFCYHCFSLQNKYLFLNDVIIVCTLPITKHTGGGDRAMSYSSFQAELD